MSDVGRRRGAGRGTSALVLMKVVDGKILLGTTGSQNEVAGGAVR